MSEKEICASYWELVGGRRLTRLTLVLPLWEGSREVSELMWVSNVVFCEVASVFHVGGAGKIS